MPPGRVAVHAARPGQASPLSQRSRKSSRPQRRRRTRSPRNGDGALVPTPIQSWFSEQRFANPNHWNQAFLFEVREDVDVDVLEQALGHVVAHHDAFRLRLPGTARSGR